MKHIDLFSGIGGFALAAKWVWGEQYENVGHSEIEKFPCKVYHKHFPDSKCLGDITKIDWRDYAGRIDLLTGGFPCQPFSVAGKHKGKEDDRWLWHEMFRAIREVKPRWVIGENVAGIVNVALDQVLSEMEGEGYTTETFIIPACALNAPHRRDRVWIVAHSISRGSQERRGKDTGEVAGGKAEGKASRDIGTTTPESNSDVANSPKLHDRRHSREQKSRQKPELGNSVEPGTASDTESRETFSTKQGGLHAEPRSADRNVGNAKSDTGDSFGEIRQGENAFAGRGDEIIVNTQSERLSKRGHKSRQSPATSELGTQHANSQTDSNGNGAGLQGIDNGTPRRSDTEQFSGHLNREWEQSWYEVATRLCRVDDGLPRRLHRVERLKSLGNAISPQVVVPIMEAIKENDSPPRNPLTR